ncbi:DUF883 family protein [Kluyvera ascorbata]|uniref:DUF883 family protein n=1 Tax=Kluyvera ascorbata TaxID=51288 RepID=UPI0004E3C58E|nr:DUF883 family protein [Kluyvera ascorbata]EJG2385888.1 DUF883 family protein [Kluyvera ascorbata]KFD02205.1 membrane protein [Kluyvera ascorbata ATCC 33433]MDU1197810.1 DUF883 family protein [Kluyvera ascorbata]STW97728.1 Bacterial protein of uncharacterised function (DUF883) [Kluyvera ascorbata]BCA38503.1 membrane protein [Kluyvera ascorbata]
MFKSLNRNNADDEVQDIHNDVSQLADSLEGIIKSWASDDKDEIEAVRHNAKKLLSETRARIHGRNRLQQSVCDVAGSADDYIRDKPWQSVSAAAAVGIFIGVLLGSRR